MKSNNTNGIGLELNPHGVVGDLWHYWHAGDCFGAYKCLDDHRLRGGGPKSIWGEGSGSAVTAPCPFDSGAPGHGSVLGGKGGGYVRMQYEGRLVLFVKELLHTIMVSQFLIHIIAISLLGIRIPGRLRAPDIAG